MISRINWPAGFEPANSPIHAANEIEINAAPDLVWRRLIEAPRWPEYYPHASEIHLPAGEDALRSGMQFTWVTAEIKLVTTVKEYVPNERIAREVLLADDATSTAYHAWLITATNGGCHVLTEETQQGPFGRNWRRRCPMASTTSTRTGSRSSRRSPRPTPPRLAERASHRGGPYENDIRDAEKKGLVHETVSSKAIDRAMEIAKWFCGIRRNRLAISSVSSAV